MAPVSSPFARIKPARNTAYSQGCMRIIRNRFARIERYVANGRSSVRPDQEFDSMLKLIRKAWPKDAGPKIHLFRWPDGNHWYASVDGRDVVENGIAKWNTEQDAEDAAKRFLAGKTQ